MPKIRVARPADRGLGEGLSVGIPSAFARVADMARLKGRLAEAEQACLTGVSKYPDYAVGHIELGLIYRSMGEPEKALIAFHTALKCEPRNVVAIKEIADIHWESGAFALARSYYRQVLQTDRYCPEALERSRRNPKRQPSNVEIADEALSDASCSEASAEVSEAEKGLFDTVTLARLYMRQGHGKLAREICASILQRNPDDKQASAILAELDRQ
jgi:tetratricopeptide (TPR) repeat protein